MERLEPEGLETKISPPDSLSRIAGFFCRNYELISLTRNWREVLTAFSRRIPLQRMDLRNGTVIMAPATLDLAFLFNEIWIRHSYTPSGYSIDDSDIVIDIGANIGVFSIYAATQAKGIQVYAYEPFKANVEWLERNVQASHLTNVRVYEMAVAGAAGSRQLVVNPSNWIAHTLQSEGTLASGTLVDTITLDEIMSGNKLARCDFLKLDCEGSEYEILYACHQDTLKRIKRVVGEFHSSIEDGKALCRFLEENSFQIDQFTVLSPTNGIFCAMNRSVSQGRVKFD